MRKTTLLLLFLCSTMISLGAGLRGEREETTGPLRRARGPKGASDPPGSHGRDSPQVKGSCAVSAPTYPGRSCALKDCHPPFEIPPNTYSCFSTSEENSDCSTVKGAGWTAISFFDNDDDDDFSVAPIDQPGHGAFDYFNDLLCKWHFDSTKYYYYLFLYKKDFYMHHQDYSACSCNDHIQVDFTTPGSRFGHSQYICGHETYYDPGDINKSCKDGISTCLPYHVDGINVTFRSNSFGNAAGFKLIVMRIKNNHQGQPGRPGQPGQPGPPGQPGQPGPPVLPDLPRISPPSTLPGCRRIPFITPPRGSPGERGPRSMRSQRSNLGVKGSRGPPGLPGPPGPPSKRSLYCRVGSYCSGTCAISTSTAPLPVNLMDLRAQASGDILDDITGDLAWGFVNSPDNVLSRIARATLKLLRKID